MALLNLLQDNIRGPLLRNLKALKGKAQADQLAVLFQALGSRNVAVFKATPEEKAQAQADFLASLAAPAAPQTEEKAPTTTEASTAPKPNQDAVLEALAGLSGQVTDLAAQVAALTTAKGA